MLLHDKFFYGCAFFLLGVFLFSVFKSIWIVSVAVLAGSVYFFAAKDRSWLWFLPLMLAGAFYFQIHGLVSGIFSVPYGKDIEISGVIIEAIHKSASQELILDLSDPYYGKIKIYARPYPRITYGSVIKLSGSVEKIPEDQADYFLKEGISGISKFPEMKTTGTDGGSSLMRRLLEIREGIIRIFNRVLPSDKSALLAGMTIGAREGFSKEFKEMMSLSGTTHLVALSGYNISLIALMISSVLRSFLPRAASFYITSMAVALFVVMTGAESSAVRAAVMGILALFAKETERQFSMKNAIIFAASGMVLINPRVLVFDLGFQLSFAALLGIIYVLPMLKKIFRSGETGVFAWKENALTTMSAQLAVAPLLLGKFGLISLTSIFANVLILEFVPLTMGLGFAIALAGSVSGFLAKVLALPAGPLLGYEIGVIRLFSGYAIPLEAGFFGLGTAVIYYLILFGSVFYYEKRFR